MANKAALIGRILDLGVYEPELTRRAMLESHALAWLVQVNGFIVDARALPNDIQDEARRRGLSPTSTNARRREHTGYKRCHTQRMVSSVWMHKTTVYLPADLRRDLEAAARETGESQADLIRRALRAYLEDQPRALPSFVGRYRGGAFAARDDEAVLEASWAPPRLGAA